jgi:hypothetical protein
LGKKYRFPRGGGGINIRFRPKYRPLLFFTKKEDPQPEADLDPYLGLTDPEADLAGPKTYGSMERNSIIESGSATGSKEKKVLKRWMLSLEGWMLLGLGYIECRRSKWGTREEKERMIKEWKKKERREIKDVKLS